ncbi:MAG TPA: DUF4149 domain-containing protein [Nitrospiria bacterium]|nr:DUF4149 domain-containing protein [Nitrospiria bacterium]
MEVPIPNFYFMGVQFVHLLALALWVGGIVMAGMVAAPVIFSRVPSRKLAGEVFGEIFRRFERVILVCIVALVATGIIKYVTWENLTPWNLTRYIAIGIMSACGLYSSLAVSPRLRALQTEIADGKGTPDQEALFDRLHRVSFQCMIVSLICGLIAILLA